ncbi:ATP-binding protein [Streptomyces sp. NPDC001812]|uniref:ATP-binding protein n=1 Tax=Streptomyces sp. NPDC001812 TaxID=3364611 RepID=UPI003692F07F
MTQRIEVVPRLGDEPPRPQDASRVRVMRRITAARLRYCGLDPLIDAVMVIISELLANALLHSRTREIILSLTLRDGFLDITVTDGMPGSATAKHVDDNAESGRGLVLVEALAKENGGTWGTSDAGAQTWCRLAVPTKARP